MKPDQVERARALVGTRFRPQGRDPRLGVDCVGLVLCAFDLPRDLVRRDYRLRGSHRQELILGFAGLFRRISPRTRRAGDVLVIRVAADQSHLAIATDAGFIHADARIGKVVESPGTPRWPVVAVFRRRQRQELH